MKSAIIVATLLGAVALSSSSFAQEPLIEPVLVPKGHTGFQLALRAGLTIPFGDVGKRSTASGIEIGDAPMSDFVSPQIPLFIDIGGKIIPERLDRRSERQEARAPMAHDRRALRLFPVNQKITICTLA